MPEFDFDLFTIGAGSGGVASSRRAASYGARVAICEDVRVGGTCVLRGCVPKKLLVYGAHFAEDFADAAGFGWTVPQPQFSWRHLIEAKDRELDRLNGVYVRLLRDSGVEIVEGRGRILDPHTVQVGERRFTAANILIATGSRAHLPDIPGIEHAITSDEALSLPQLPARMVIVGGGYIAVEFAGIFNALGVKVTQILRADTILRNFDQDMRFALAQEMEQKGINLRCETLVRSIEKRPDGGLTLRTADHELIETDVVLYATGRVPNSAGLGLEEMGIALGPRGAIPVDQGSRTQVPSIYAVGDVTDRINLTPVAINEGRALAETLFNDNPMTMDYENVASAVFSQPPLATVGLTEQQAREKHGKIDCYISRFRPMKNTLSGRQERTVMKLVVDRASQRVVGVHMVGPDAPEIIQGFAVALKCGATKQQFDRTVGIHPSAAEEFVTMRDPVPDPDGAGEE